MSVREPVGVIHGRFQVLHNDHLRYLLAGKELCRHLVVGITNPDPLLSRADPADPALSAARANPLSYYERYRLVRAALEEAEVSHDAFSVVPFPVNLPELYRYYVPLDAIFYLTIYDEWGRTKLERFVGLGLRTHVLWERPMQEKGLRGTGVRHLMAAGLPWEHLVPASGVTLLKQWRVPERLRAETGLDGAWVAEAGDTM
jgi:nicotinamide mononucleotide adenylyltransferase